MKKIAIVNVFFPPQSIGGATRIVADNIDELVKNYNDDFKLVVFTCDVNQRKEHKLKQYLYKGCRVYQASVIFREHMDWHPKDDLMKDLFLEFLELEKPDLIHFHCVQRLTASVVEAAKTSEIPYIVTVHDAWWISDYQFLVDHQGTVYPEGHPENDVFRKRVLPERITEHDSIARSFYLKDLLNNAQKVLSVSDSFKDIYVKNGILNVVTNKNGISNQINWAPQKTIHSEKVVCAHIGGMSEHKGYHLFKTAIENLQPENIEVLLVDHSKEEDYEEKCKWGAVDVTIIGRVHQNKITELYGRMNVLFAPSMWPESYGLVTREAAASGCWVVTSNLGGIGEDVSDTVDGFVITPDQKSVDSVITEIDVNHFKYTQQIVKNNIRKINEQVNELISIYKEL